MTRLRRTTTEPIGTPIAGNLTYDDMGRPIVPLNLDTDLQLLIDDPKVAHDLMAAAGVVASVLDAALGMPAPPAPRCSCDEDPLQCAHQARLGEAADDRDAFRALLARIVSVRTYQELQVVAEEARQALDRYDRRGVELEPGEGVTSP